MSKVICNIKSVYGYQALPNVASLPQTKIKKNLIAI